MSKQINNLLLFILIAASITSCIPQKKLRYLQQQEESKIDTTNANDIDNNYILKPKDELYINVNSINPETYSFFNPSLNGSSNSNMSTLGLYLNSYDISDSGYIQMPVVGKIYVEGLDLEQARFRIEQALRNYLKDVSVTIKFSAFRFTIIGEVKNPGKYAPYKSRLNILEAIALAGDMTSYGNRERIMVIRNINGKENVHFINILDKNILKSKDFNLLPNDIIYVESLNAKTWGFEHFPYSLLFSTITMIIVLTTFIKSL